MQLFSSMGSARAALLCAGVAGIGLMAGAAFAQPNYAAYPPPPPGYRDYPPPPPAPERDPRYADHRYADPAYESYQTDRDYREPPPAPRYAETREDGRDSAERYRPAQRPAPYRRQAAARAPVARPATDSAMSVAEVALPHRLVEAAHAYASYMVKAGSIRSDFKSGAGVAEAVRTGAGYEHSQLSEGAIAYAAMTALQEPSFVAAARQLLREGDGGEQFAAELAGQPYAVMNIPNADLAAARAASALHRHGLKLVASGAEVKQAAYDVQHSAWSKSEVANPGGRLAAAKSISAHRVELKGDGAPELKKALLSEASGDGQGAGSPLVTRALAIAALAATGQLRGEDDPSLAALLSEPRSADCLKMAKLNLFQCLSVSRPHYEDIFCLGQHGMMETGQCVVKAAGYTPAPTTVARAGAR